MKLSRAHAKFRLVACIVASALAPWLAAQLLVTHAAPAAVVWPAIQLTELPLTVSSPVYIGHAGDGSGRLFIVERTGTIRIFKNGALLSTPFLSITSRVKSNGPEEGLLSVAFPPNYGVKQHFYVYYVNLNGNLTIARYGLTANPDIANPMSETVVLVIPHPGFVNHNGGQLQFGPDGYLYAGIGDGGDSGDPPNNAQTTTVLLGKMLRIDVESSYPAVPTYTIPASNPFTQTAGYRPEIWARGLRNPWRFSFDRQTGDLYIGDVGQNLYEEVDFQPANSAGGQNYGWRIMEGLHCYNPNPCNMTGLTLPVWEYSSAGAGAECSVTGGYVYRGAQYTTSVGIYFYGDFCTGKIWGLKFDGGVWQNQLLYDSPFNISTFGEDEEGDLYVANISTGKIYRIMGLERKHYLPLIAR